LGKLPTNQRHTRGQGAEREFLVQCYSQAEIYYSVAVFTCVKLSLDYQFVDHPAYNRDRGPVSIFGFRAHGEF